jgi:uncharacterized protein YrrD
VSREETGAVEAMQIVLGAPVRCEGDVVGRVADVLVDPAGRRYTHVVVQTHDRQARLVPAELVTAAAGGQRGLTLTCTFEQLLGLESIRHFEYVGVADVPALDRECEVGVEDMVAMPCYDTTALGDYVGDFEAAVGLTYDQIPKGRAELRRSSTVRSTDGHKLGHVDGFIVADGEVTHLVVEWGHLWLIRRAAIPVDAIASIDTDLVTVGLSKDDVRLLPV